ncbi:MAG: ABC transporter ATP-binding protein [Treponema sp.]|jgi:ABC-type sugar transport system ATPase subunit|nr:ABC transporter ATP-binding protein [Treponema sp.]
MNPIVQFRDIKKIYRKNEVLKGVSLDVQKGDFLVLFGLPGSGRSVLLRILMGLEKPSGGSMLLRGRDASEIEPGKRNIGYIPQSFALFPHMTVFDNIAYPLKLARVEKNKIKAEVDRVAEQLGIDSLLSRMPDQTSGGQKQRIAIARGIVQDTDLFIFDDPLAGLDFKLREQLVDDLKALQEKMQITIMYSTSDSLEALSLANTIAILNNGVITESGTPEDMYLNPKHADTLRLLGFPSANIFEADLDGSAAAVSGIFDLSLSAAPKSGKILAGFRPESVLWTRPEESCFAVEGKVLLCEDLGGEEIVYLGVADKIITVMRFHYEEMAELPYGTTVSVFIPEKDIVCFDTATLNRL